MGFLQNKKLLITGLLSNRSIAYGIAQAAVREGKKLVIYKDFKIPRVSKMLER